MGKYKKKLQDNKSIAKSSRTSLKRKIKKHNVMDLQSQMKEEQGHFRISQNEKLKSLSSHNQKKKGTTPKRHESTPATSSGSTSVGKVKKRERKETISLRERMMNRLQGARFRFLNEQMYKTDGQKSNQLFKKDPRSFQAYHEGFQQQVTQWKVNPLDNIITNLKKKSPKLVIADFGCGDARLAESLPNKVHSFDLVALNEHVTACDMSKTPLEDSSVDIAVFCLSLMGTNLNDYLVEANRVLKTGGQLKIAEVESRFDDVQKFIRDLKRFGFKNTSKNLSNTYFYFMDFKKENPIIKRKSLPCISLKPCMYKKR